MEGTAKRYWTTDEVDERVQQKTKELLEQLKQLKEENELLAKTNDKFENQILRLTSGAELSRLREREKELETLLSEVLPYIDRRWTRSDSLIEDIKSLLSKVKQ